MIIKRIKNTDTSRESLPKLFIDGLKNKEVVGEFDKNDVLLIGILFICRYRLLSKVFVNQTWSILKNLYQYIAI